MSRPSWDQYFIDITLDVSRRATCLRAQVGAIIVKDKRILTTGYNGAPKGLPHCLHYEERIRLGSGSTQAIGKVFSRVQSGEIVLVRSYDFASQRVVAKRVTKAFRQPAYPRMWMKIITEGHRRGQRLYLSAEHKVYRVDDNVWVEAKDLHVGQRLLHEIPLPTSFQKQILIGCSLGDGSVARLKSWGAYLQYLHSAKQREYALWKANILTPFSTATERTTHAFGREWDQVAVYCQVHPSLSPVLLASPPDRLEQLDEVGLACWYQDDGTKKMSNTPHLCTYSWTQEQVTEAARNLTRKFGIHFTVSRHSKYFGLAICAHSKYEFFERIAPYIHPSMQYKLPERYRTGKVPIAQESPTQVSEMRIVSIETSDEDIVGYDIEVEDTHNFFTANGVLISNCLDEGCEIVDGHCVRSLHAEQNAILQGALHGVSLEGGTIYTTHQPCATCAKMIINAGLVRVVYAGLYPDELAMKYLKRAGIRVDHFDLGERTPAPPPSVAAKQDKK